MKNSPRYTCIAFFILTFFSWNFSWNFPVFGTEEVHAEEAPPYRIGAILPLSGSAASLGNYLKNGIDLALSELSDEDQSKIEVIYEDDQLKAPMAVSAFQRLKSQKNIQAVFVLGSGIGNAIAPLAERAGIVCIAIGASDGGIAKGKKFAFTHWVTPEVEAEVMIAEMLRRGYQRIGVVGTEQEGAIAVMDAVHAAIEKKNIQDKLVVEKNFLPDDTDFKTYIAQMKQKEVDTVITILFPGALSSFAKQARQLGLGADLAGIELFEDESEVKASEGALVGHWYVNADVATDSFQTLYQAKYGEAPGWAAANAFDSVNLLVRAVRSEVVSNQSVAHMLATLKDYSGAAGEYSATGDNRFGLPATIKVVEKDGFSKLNG